MPKCLCYELLHILHSSLRMHLSCKLLFSIQVIPYYIFLMNKPSTFVSEMRERDTQRDRKEKGKIILQHTTTLLCTLLNVFLKVWLNSQKKLLQGLLQQWQQWQILTLTSQKSPKRGNLTLTCRQNKSSNINGNARWKTKK